MLRYPKEYEEALSRLNAPERSPLPYAPIPYGPTPNYCNYMNWNRIMAETRQGVMPKYSILQRIDLGSQNDLVNVSDAKEYTYTLDPSFTFAKGARKSIAVRAVDIYNVIPNGQTRMATETCANGIRIEFVNADGPQTLDITLSQFTYEISNDLQTSMVNFAEAFAKYIFNLIKSGRQFYDLFESYDATYNPPTRQIVVTFYVYTQPYRLTGITNLTPDDAVHNYPYWSIQHSTMVDYYNLDLSQEENLRKQITGQFDSNYWTLRIKIPKTTLDVRQAAVCGSINPWTKNNLIAPLTYSSDTLTKVFPWNGCTEAKFWFINENGEKVRWRVVRGYIDLELIIDNSDSYAIDNN